jgi:hypothetical protein
MSAARVRLILATARPIHQRAHDGVSYNCARNGEKERPDQCRPNQPHKDVAVQIIPDRDVAKFNVARFGPMKDAVSNLVFPPENCRHQWKDHIVQCHRDRGRDFVAFAQPGDTDRQQRFHGPKRSEAEEYADGRPECDGMGRICNSHQRHVMRAEPAFEAHERAGQPGAVAQSCFVHKEN